MPSVTRSSFSRQNLRGRSFKEQDLSGTDFSHADLRGANFTDAVLRGANFQGAKAGLQRRWIVAWSLILLILIPLVGLLSALGGLYLGYLTTAEVTSQYTLLPSVIVLGTTTILGIIIFRQGLLAGINAIVITCIIAIAAGSVGILTIPNLNIVNFADTFVGAIATIISIVVNVAVVYPILFAIIILLTDSAKIGFAASIVGAAIGTFQVAQTYSSIGSLITTASGAIGFMGLSAYVGWRGVRGDEKHFFVHRIATAFLALGGTNFSRSNLEGVNFAQAALKHTNFKNANLTQTNFHTARHLDRASVINTILINPIVRDLVVTHRGANQSYVGCQLNGANLIGADLTSADLTDADLSGATFEQAWLERANLTRTQALGTNFKQATLTGACLESWNIDGATQLEGVNCEYVYLSHHQHERRPSSGTFAPGEFTKLFQQVVSTIDLIFSHGIDWKAFAASFHQLQIENEGTELEVRSVENKGDGVVVIRVNAPATVDKPRLHAELTQRYNRALQQLEERYRRELKQKDEQIDFYQQQQKSLTEVLQHIVTSPNHLEQRETHRSVPERTGKVVILKFTEGTLATGFSVTMQLGSEGALPSTQIFGELPPAPELFRCYYHWRSAYLKSLNAAFRLDIPATQITNVSSSEVFEDCDEAARILKTQLNHWLNAEGFRPIKERMLEKLHSSELIRLIIQTETPQLRRLPWSLWDLCDRYPNAEIALSQSAFETVDRIVSPKTTVKILAILGDSSGIDVQQDRAILEQLPQADVTFLVEPRRQDLNEQLWQQPWDIFFFAGHSASQDKSQNNSETGYLSINPSDRLTIPQIKHALSRAIAQGLRLAVFNSCDGIGLASDLADLHLPQMIVMREPVPDLVAQVFLKNFLMAFSSGKPLYQSVREARERLQGLEDRFPCATWMPVIFQNPAEVPITWKQF
jgi:uncharacterized protein YjbI with pentapeptide repeats